MQKIIYGIFYLLLLTILVGCSASKEDLQIENLNQQINKLFSQLEDKEKTIQELNSKLSFLQKDNVELNVSLEKANTNFSEKNKVSLENETIKKYIGYALIPFIILLSTLIYLIFSTRQYKKVIKDLEKSIDDKDKKMEGLNKANNTKKEEIEKLESDKFMLKIKSKEGVKNQIVTKLEEYERKREKQIKSIEVD